MFDFRRWARATKIKRNENLTDEIFLTRKFPDLWYTLLLGMPYYVVRVSVAGSRWRSSVCYWKSVARHAPNMPA